ncbi:hypothetical protein D3C72_916540 [compost metagenome]
MASHSRRRASNSIWRPARTSRWPSAGTGPASSRRATCVVITSPPWPPPRGRGRCSGLRPRFSRRRNITATPRWPRPPPATAPRRTSASPIWTRWPRITGNSRTGPSTARRTSRTAPCWSAPRSPVWKAVCWMPSMATSKPSTRRRRAASSTSRRWPTNWRRASTRRAGWGKSPGSTCRMRATLTCAGAPMARCGIWRPSIRTCAPKTPCPARPPPSPRRWSTSTWRPCSRCLRLPRATSCWRT